MAHIVFESPSIYIFSFTHTPPLIITSYHLFPALICRRPKRSIDGTASAERRHSPFEEKLMGDDDGEDSPGGIRRVRRCCDASLHSHWSISSPLCSYWPVFLTSALNPCMCSFSELSNRGEVQSLWSWGWNQYGQLGHTHRRAQVATPRQLVLPRGSHVASLAGGGRHTVAVLELRGNRQVRP